MKLPFLALRNYQFVGVVVLLALFIGLRAYLTMPRAEDPFLYLPNYTVVAVYPGTDAEDMEELVADPIEEAIDALDDIEELRTTIEEGLVVIEVEGKYGIDADDKKEELVTEVENLRDELPPNLYSLEVVQFKPEDRFVVQQYALTSLTATEAELYDLADDMKKMLEKVPALKEAEIEAYREEQVRVNLDFSAMAARYIPLGQVLQVLQSQNANIPAGTLNAGNQSLSIKTSGSYKNLQDLEETVIAPGPNGVVKLKDIATVAFDYEDARWQARYNGQPGILVTVKQERGTNIIGLAEGLVATEAAFKSQLPPYVNLHNVFAQAPSVKARIADFFVNLLQGVLLVGVVILLFLGFRSALIVMTVIPLSIIIAIGLLNGMDYALQQISIAALVIALGLLVDNGIVVVENISRFIKSGYSRFDAAAKGTAEVGYAIVSSTVTTLLAFAPLALLQSGPGEFLRSLPVTVILVLTVSLLLALTVTPLIANGVMRKKVTKATWTDRRIQKFIDRFYAPVLNFALKRGWVVVLVAVATLVGSVTLFPSIGVSFFPTADKPLLLVEVDTPNGSNLARTNRAVRYVEAVLDTTAYVKDYTANVGHGNPQVYYNRIPKEYNRQHGQLMVRFKEWNPARFYATLGQLRGAFAQYPDARIAFRELKNGAPFKAPVEILVLGENLDTLRQLNTRVASIIGNTAGTKDVYNPLATYKTAIEVNINKAKAGVAGMPVAAIDQAVMVAMNGMQIDKLTLDDNEEYPLVVRMPLKGKPGIDNFSGIQLNAPTGQMVPLAQMASLELSTSVPEIRHFNLDRSTAVTADVLDADATAAITEQVIAKLDSMAWPAGYSYYVAGEYERQQESFGDLGTLLIVALLGIFAVLVLQFRSLRQPLIVFSAIPLAITGSFVALYLTGWTFSFFAFVGFISLVGIVVNNSIILVDFTNQLMAQGTEKLEAIKRAAQVRFTPIVLTTTTTILGLLPLTLSNTSLWSPLGWTIIGGMVSSTLLTLILVPVLYKWFTSSKKVASLQ